MLLRIDRARFDALAARFPRLPLALAKSMAERVRRSNTESATQAPRVIAIAPLQDSLHRGLARQIEAVLMRGNGRVLRMTSRTFDAEFGRFGRAETDPARDSLGACLLAEQESHFDTIL